MEATRTLQDKVFLFIKGLAMGAANKVPGVREELLLLSLDFMKNSFIHSKK